MIPLTAPHLREGVQRVQTLEELLKLPKAHIGHVLATILPIYRQKCEVNGKRYTNASLITQVLGKLAYHKTGVYGRYTPTKQVYMLDIHLKNRCISYIST